MGAGRGRIWGEKSETGRRRRGRWGRRTVVEAGDISVFFFFPSFFLCAANSFVSVDISAILCTDVGDLVSVTKILTPEQLPFFP
jgi:hypothetical protein